MKVDSTIVSMSLTPELLEKFDAALKRKGFSTRSEALRDALRGFVDEAEWEGRGDNALILTILYEKPQAGSELSTLQHRFHEIQSMLHLHIDERNCLEIFVAKGESTKLKELVTRIRKVRGIKKVGLITTTSGV